jgi:threonine/homoserine/homoserine lactone efflux protein
MNLQTLIVAFVVSYVGSIPPGTINVTVMQLAIQRRRRAAVFFAFAAAAVEFVYAGFTVQFHLFLTGNENIADYFRLITSMALIGLGLWNLFSRSTSESVIVNSERGRHGFLRGMILGILNPMTIPFWLAITTYLENDNLVEVDGYGFWMYLIGLAVGTFCLLLTVNGLGHRFTKIADNKFLVHKVPGLILLSIGVYFLLKLSL